MSWKPSSENCCANITPSMRSCLAPMPAGEATAASDIDVVVVGGAQFRARDIFAFGEELRQRTCKDVDAFELREVNAGTPFYENIMREGVRIS